MGWGPAQEGCAPSRPRWSSSKALCEQYMLTDAPRRMDGEICGSPRTKERMAEHSRWEDALQKGEMFKLGGKKQLRGGMIR